MPMEQNGLGKLIEEMGEALQIAGKMIGYPHHQSNNEPIRLTHPDGTHLRYRLEEELGDVLAAIRFVDKKLRLDTEKIISRCEEKMALFQKWDQEKG